MTLVPLPDLRDDRARALHNLEAEYALLGIVLYDNQALDQIEGLREDHFAEPFHGRLWALCGDIIHAGQLAEPILLQRRLGADPAFKELGGVGFLASLVEHAPPSPNAPDYAAEIIDLATRRTALAALESAARDLRGAQKTAVVVEALDSALLAMHRHDGRARLLSAEEAVRDMLADLNAPEGADSGVLTGLEPLDEHLGRLQPEELILIAGRPGSGKSALGACVALNVAKTGVGVIEINSEMSTRQMTRRHVADLCFGRWGIAAPTYRDIKRRHLTAPQWNMIEWAGREISALPLAMVKQTGLGLSALRSIVRRQAGVWIAKGVQLGLVTVDHAGLLDADTHGRDRYSDQTQIAIGMKALAGELKVPLACMVQLSRKVEDRDNKRPQLWDLRDSGAWEENADTAIGLYREAYYANKEPEPKADGRNADERWDSWSRRKHSKIVEAGLMKVREGEETVIKLWASIGHNAIRGADPDDGGFL